MVSKSLPVGSEAACTRQVERIMNVIGIDVSKDKLDCLWLRDLATGKAKSKVVPNQPCGYQALLAWAEKSVGGPVAVPWVVMGATGVYHEALAAAATRRGAPRG